MPARATESASGFRKYRYKGRELTSVTTILSNGVPKQGPLVPWAAKAVATEAVEQLAKLTGLVESIGQEGAINWLKGAQYRTKKAAGFRGTEIHNLAEAHALGKPLPPVSAAALPLVAPLMAFLDDFQPEPVHVEVTAFSPSHNYAGTLDSIAKFEEFGTVLFDWKTSKGVYGETALQLSAYAHADFLDVDNTEVPIPNLDGALIVHIAPTGYALFKADISEETFGYFLACQKVAEFQTNYSRHVLTSI
jgi:hypothetical protein